MKIKLYDLVEVQYSQSNEVYIGLVVKLPVTTMCYEILTINNTEFIAPEVFNGYYDSILVGRDRILKVLYHDYFVPDTEFNELVELREKVKTLEHENYSLKNFQENKVMEAESLKELKSSLRKFLEIKEPIYEECPF